MSKRLQVLLTDEEMVDLRNLATREHLTVRAYVRRTLLEARANRPIIDAESKLKAVREKEIERGYEG